MDKNRLEAFSDGVIAIIITIMVLELKPPSGTGWDDLLDSLPELISYVLSFVYIAIYWNNHHHMMHMVKHVNGKIMWANTHLLFWLSLIPLTTEWMWIYPDAKVPGAVYGMVLMGAALAYLILEKTIMCSQGADSLLRITMGRDLRGKLSPLLYMSAIFLAYVSPKLSDLVYFGVALIWIVPDRRIERALVSKS
jgi:uncharacterized membrane protein